MPQPATPLPPEVLHALQQGNLIQAIKLLRSSGGFGLKQAKEVLEAHLRTSTLGNSAPGRPARTPQVVEQALQRGNRAEAVQSQAEQAGLGLRDTKEAVDALRVQEQSGLDGRSPGEVPRDTGGWWWIVGCAGALIAAYYLSSGGA